VSPSEALRLARIAVGMLRVRREQGALTWEDLVQIATMRILEAPAPPDTPPGRWALRCARNAVLVALRREKRKGFTRAPPESDGREIGQLPILEGVPQIGRQMRAGRYEADALETCIGVELLATYTEAQSRNHGGAGEPAGGSRERLEEVRRGAVRRVQRPVALCELTGMRGLPDAQGRLYGASGGDLPPVLRQEA
jgi:DNA-directed RNA polymerase specialized sigma24 family protein